MSVIRRLETLRDRAVGDFTRLQDFQELTGTSYGVFEKAVSAGLTANSFSTGSMTILDAKQVAEVLRRYLDDDLPRIAIYQIVAEFEAFFFDFHALLLEHNPRALRQDRQIAVRDVMTHKGLNSLIAELIRDEGHELAYQKVQVWFERLRNVVNLKAISDADVEHIAEIKATRDIVAHNAGIANDIYIVKAGKAARAAVGETLPVTRPYTYESARFLKEMIKKMTDAATARLA
jgi:hypothetical protein